MYTHRYTHRQIHRQRGSRYYYIDEFEKKNTIFIQQWYSESVMSFSDEWVTRGSMCNFERRGLPILSKLHIGPSVAHSSLKPITDSISSMVPMYCLKKIKMTSLSYKWISFVTPIVEEKTFISLDISRG